MDEKNLQGYGYDYQTESKVQPPLSAYGGQDDAARGQQGPLSPPPPAYYPQANQLEYPPPNPYGYPTSGYPSQPPPTSAFAYQPPAAAHQQQQQQSVVVVGGQQQMTVAYQPMLVSMTGAIVLSCFAFWCCGMLFGGIAFIIAMIGESSRRDEERLNLRRASYGLSIAAFVIGVVVFALAIGLFFGLGTHIYNYSTSQNNCVKGYNALLKVYTCN